MRHLFDKRALDLAKQLEDKPDLHMWTVEMLAYYLLEEPSTIYARSSSWRRAERDPRVERQGPQPTKLGDKAGSDVRFLLKHVRQWLFARAAEYDLRKGNSEASELDRPNV